MEITGFRHKGLERFWRTGDPRGIAPKWAEKVRAMLTAIEEADTVAEIGVGPWLEASSGEGRAKRCMEHVDYWEPAPDLRSPWGYRERVGH